VGPRARLDAVVKKFPQRYTIELSRLLKECPEERYINVKDLNEFYISCHVQHFIGCVDFEDTKSSLVSPKVGTASDRHRPI
jgi:hypothetical protein